MIQHPFFPDRRERCFTCSKTPSGSKRKTSMICKIEKMPLLQLYSESAVCKDHPRTSKKPSGAKDLRLPMTKHRAIRNALAHMSQVENMPKVLFCDPILASPKCFVLTVCNDSPVSCVKSLNPNQPHAHTFLANPSHFLGILELNHLHR